MEPLLGMIIIFAGNFPPRGWAFCNGQILSIAQNTALFSILGTTYGGNGQTTFALPDLRGRAPIGWGQGPGLSNYSLGEVIGTESITMLSSQMPTHTHPITTTIKTQSQQGDLVTPVATSAISAVKDINGDPAKGFSSAAPDIDLTSAATSTAGVVGGNQPISIMQPILSISYIIATEGIFPSRN